MIFGIIGYVSGTILLIFPVYYMAYFLASWILASRQETTNYKAFVDLGEIENSFQNKIFFKRNLIKARDSQRRMSKIGKINAEKNVISHTSQNKV